MENEIIFTSDTDSTSYIESLIKAYERLIHIHNAESPLVQKIAQVIAAELDLALLSAEKARSDLLKSNKDSVVKPIK